MSHTVSAPGRPYPFPLVLGRSHATTNARTRLPEPDEIRQLHQQEQTAESGREWGLYTAAVFKGLVEGGLSEDRAERLVAAYLEALVVRRPDDKGKNRP